MKKIFFPLLAYLFVNSITANPENQEQIYVPLNALDKSGPEVGQGIDTDLLAPVKFTPDGIQEFLKHVFDNPKYAKEIFPNNMNHFLQFIEFGVKTNQGREYLEQVIRLFRQKVMCSEYVCAREVALTSERLVALLEGFEIVEEKNSTKEHETAVKELCYNMFLNEFDKFKANPDSFLTDLSKEICKILDTHAVCSKETSAKHIQNLIIRFMETTLYKVLWSPDDGENTWEEFRILGESVSTLFERKVISREDDLNDLIKIIVERFNYFITIAGSEMPISFYEKARKDVDEDKFAWLNVEELEKDITSKKESLRRNLIQGQIKAQARSVYGIITED